MIAAGSLDRRIELQSFAIGSSGDPTAGTWSLEKIVWAERMDARGAERATGGMVQAAEATQAYRIRNRTTVDPTWRVVDRGELWDIVAAVPGPERNQETILFVRRFDPNDAN